MSYSSQHSNIQSPSHLPSLTASIDFTPLNHDENITPSHTPMSLKDKPFNCRFDPTIRSSRSLVLIFDKEGNSKFEEMSRGSILRMVQAPATPTSSSTIREKRYNPTHGSPKSPSNNVNRQSLPHGTICDVQRVHARDIRKLDNAFAVSTEPSIELRNQAILVNADPIRAIIMWNSCLIFVPDGADSLLSLLREKFKEVNFPEAKEVAYEFRALEALLSTLSGYFHEDYNRSAPVISTALDNLVTGKTSAPELEQLRVFKNNMNEFETHVNSIRRAMMELLDNEEDLRLLYLTKLRNNPDLLNDLYSFDSEEAEVLIENYLQDIFSTRTKASLMQHRIHNTESLVMLKLDSMRNYLLGIDIVFSIVAISLSTGTFISGIFGMNLYSGVEDRPGWFWCVAGFAVCLAFTISIGILALFKKQGVFL